jgi:hypothetical protein
MRDERELSEEVRLHLANIKSPDLASGLLTSKFSYWRLAPCPFTDRGRKVRSSSQRATWWAYPLGGRRGDQVAGFARFGLSFFVRYGRGFCVSDGPESPML